jgi:hypothetical protein
MLRCHCRPSSPSEQVISDVTISSTPVATRWLIGRAPVQIITGFLGCSKTTLLNFITQPGPRQKAHLP